MNILITGSAGFIGKNLVYELYNQGFENIYQYDINTPAELLDEYCQNCEFVFHLAGINRPDNCAEYMAGNYGFTSTLLDTLKKYRNSCPIILSSSIQSKLNNPYGISKKAGEELLFQYGIETGSKILVYRFPNVFGKWCRPHYNSVVATFCHNIANNLPIEIHNRDTVLELVYIDDLVSELVSTLNRHPLVAEDGFCYVAPTHRSTLGEIADEIISFKTDRFEAKVPNMLEGGFTKKLYATYLSYLPQDEFSYPLKMNVDERGSFTELIRTPERGQFSVNILKPGITKGNHWHHTKNEKFVVVSGNACIQFRKIGCSEVITYHVSGERIEVVDIPVGYTHSIKNEGSIDLVTFIWCNECFNQEKPDTYFLKVENTYE